ncbi:uncharacterized protein LOC142238382 isoform X8 [Haematobia irritans]|uniref:uncharacterized protein LOC142238382 isoform X8 n=1 Tax=Haematobia irritans TaxID=7368 RepID=UPI003F505A3C
MDLFYVYCLDFILLTFAIFLMKLLAKFLCNLHCTWVHDNMIPNYVGVGMRDRQGNVFTIHDENSRESRYNDIFFIEPNSVEAARIRAQLEKDDKDLPSYEEVMRMTSMNPPPPTTTTNTAEMGASNASVNTTETRLSVPPYSEIDPNASSTSLNASSLMATATPSSDSTLPTHSQSAPPPLFAAAVVSSSLTQTTSNV